MESTAAKTAMGPLFRVALEQLVPKEKKILHDAVAYNFLPPLLKGIINLCRINLIRQLFLNLEDKKAPGVRGGLLCRKRYIDDKLIQAIKNGIETVVILGSGFDSRAYRLSELASTHIYEVDLPINIQFKERKLIKMFKEVPSHVILVPIDFNTQKLEDKLLLAGYSLEQPTFFVWEGVTQYLPETVVHTIFEFLAKAKPGSQLAFTYIRKDFIDGEKMYGLEIIYKNTRNRTQLWKFGIEPEIIDTFLNNYSWKRLENVGNAEYQNLYLEPIERKMPVMEIERMVLAEKN
ncbi:MAG: class I SAM-dependent methyltransferase [Promethearchaeota archaeon]